MISGLDAIRDPTLLRAFKGVDGQLAAIQGAILAAASRLTINLAVGPDVMQIFVSATEPPCPQGVLSLWLDDRGTGGGELKFGCPQLGSGVWDWESLGGTTEPF
jgi:hypothetical protein